MDHFNPGHDARSWLDACREARLTVRMRLIEGTTFPCTIAAVGDREVTVVVQEEGGETVERVVFFHAVAYMEAGRS